MSQIAAGMRLSRCQQQAVKRSDKPVSAVGSVRTLSTVARWRHLQQATRAGGLPDDSLPIDNASGLWEPCGLLATDHISPDFDDCELLEDWRVRRRCMVAGEKSKAAMADDIFAMPHRPHQGNSLEELKHQAVYGSSDDDINPMHIHVHVVASSAVTLASLTYRRSAIGVTAAGVRDGSILAGGNERDADVHADDPLGHLPNRFNLALSELMNDEQLAICAAILTDKEPATAMHNTQFVPHITDDIIGGVGAPPLDNDALYVSDSDGSSNILDSSSSSRGYAQKASAWLSSWDMDWLDVPGAPNAGSAVEGMSMHAYPTLAGSASATGSGDGNETRCVESLRHSLHPSSAAYAASVQAVRAEGGALDFGALAREAAEADAHVVVRDAAQIAERRMRTAQQRMDERVVKDAIRHQQEHERDAADSLLP